MAEDMNIDAKAVIEDAHHDTLNDLFLSANLASEQEKQVGVKEAILKYPREIFWAIIFALGLVMAGLRRPNHQFFVCEIPVFARAATK